jgi:hypothetical protein
MFTGWYKLIKGKIHPNREFVSVDASLRPNAHPRNLRSYEMLDSSGKDNISKTPDTILTPITPAAKTKKDRRITPDYFGKEPRYSSPSRSFSSPRPPQKGQWGFDATTSEPSYRMDPLSMNKI